MAAVLICQPLSDNKHITEIQGNMATQEPSELM